MIYHHGLVGAAFLFVFYFGTGLHAFKSMRDERTSSSDRTLCLAVLACLVAERLAGNTENPFATSDKALMIGALAGLVGSARWRTSQQPDPSDDAR